MTALLSAVFVRLRGVLTDPMFAVSVLFNAVLCASAPVYTDPVSMNEYTAFNALFYFSRADMLSDTAFSAPAVLRCCGGGWLGLFLPITAAFAWAQCFCVRRESGVLRFEAVRQSRFSHACADFLSGLIAGAVGCLLGLLLFAGAVYLLYPAFTDYAEPLRTEYLTFQQMLTGNAPETAFGAVLAERAVCLMLCGISYAAPAIVLGSVVRSPFTVLCIPFFFAYALQSLLDAMPFDALPESGLRWRAAIRPGALLYASAAAPGLSQIMLVRALLVLGCFAVFLAVRTAQTDQGGAA